MSFIIQLQPLQFTSYSKAANNPFFCSERGAISSPGVLPYVAFTDHVVGQGYIILCESVQDKSKLVVNRV